jgi:excinuclease ABC subunit B
VAEEKRNYNSAEIESIIKEKQKAMEEAAKNLDFITAAKFRDEIKMLME